MYNFISYIVRLENLLNAPLLFLQPKYKSCSNVQSIALWSTLVTAESTPFTYILKYHPTVPNKDTSISTVKSSFCGSFTVRVSAVPILTVILSSVISIPESRRSSLYLPILITVLDTSVTSSVL